MTVFVSNKVVRLLLAASVSMWLAGGCIFGCSNMAMGAHVSDATETPAASAESCHAKRSHDCCAKPKAKKHVVTKVKLEGVTSFAPAPAGAMNDCPLLGGSTAATSKNNTVVPDPERALVTTLPSFEKQNSFAEKAFVAPFLRNRGSTHLLACVFLI
jgi:hypothetical protein